MSVFFVLVSLVLGCLGDHPSGLKCMFCEFNENCNPDSDCVLDFHPDYEATIACCSPKIDEETAADNTPQPNLRFKRDLSQKPVTVDNKLEAFTDWIDRLKQTPGYESLQKLIESVKDSMHDKMERLKEYMSKLMGNIRQNDS